MAFSHIIYTFSLSTLCSPHTYISGFGGKDAQTVYSVQKRMHPRNGSNNFRQPPFTNTVTKSFIVQSQIISLSRREGLTFHQAKCVLSGAVTPPLLYCQRFDETMPCKTPQGSLCTYIFVCMCVSIHLTSC